MTLWRRLSLPRGCKLLARSVKDAEFLLWEEWLTTLTPVFEAGAVAGCQAALGRWSFPQVCRNRWSCGHEQEAQPGARDPRPEPAPWAAQGHPESPLNLAPVSPGCQHCVLTQGWTFHRDTWVLLPPAPAPLWSLWPLSSPGAPVLITCSTPCAHQGSCLKRKGSFLLLFFRS